ncbi:FTR1 family protein [Luteimonas wenzhouensis]|jgi:high-affinity iron transporter|uniref:C-type cytochrome n=1 Tax=Luteimonas wenzhouensis TaxID=2599615 RepID=A0A5C5U6Y0_9GAMM|nr:FTR1 family protein [Luteimonas wenzhouensis]NLW95254.1 c-type cytochrome [Xanthomonadaceae bacterium]TWT21577.1 c-type cytochrome [Luteimonas wenzhouensis]
MSPRLLLATLLSGLALILACLPAGASESSVATTWRLLDYIAVDYREAVAEGEVVNQLEYDEMLEFSQTAAEAIAALPPTPEAGRLQGDAQALRQAILDKGDPVDIARRARGLAALLVQAHPIPLVPDTLPHHARGAELYARLCASCHGPTGAGDGPAGAGLDPPPIDFTDRERADERSVFALYQVIEQGLEGTSMASYRGLPADDLWALATYSGALAYPEALVEAGRARLDGDPALRASFDLARFVGQTPADLAAELGSAEDAAAVVAYLRRHPEALRQATDAEGAALATSRRLLREAMDAYRAGDATGARQRALSAYLDGFEPVEPLLAARDKPLMVRIEAAMAQLRSGIAANADPGVLQAQVDALDGLFAQAEAALGQGRTSSAASFLAAFTILLREGLEALLIVVAMIVLLRKAGRDEMLPWVHGGWIAALAAGAATWALATWVIGISGASRELSEGFGALLAAVVLVWVGIWMHGKGQADAWQRYVREKLGQALGRGSGLFLLALVFVVVYREVFETILFFAALWGQGSRSSVVAGGAAGALALAVVGWALMRWSRRLPIARFFRYSAILIAVLAVVLAGKAVSALQEAGWLPVTWLDGWPRLEWLGLSPTLLGVAVQLLVVAVLVAGFAWSGRKARAAAA